MTTVAVVGATGGIGRHVVRMAHEAGFRVRALARRPERIDAPDGVERMMLDLWQEQSVGPALRGADVVLSCLGNDRGRRQITHLGTQAMLSAVPRARRFVAISSLGVGDSAAQARRLSWVYAALIMPTVLRRPLADLARMEEAMQQSSVPTVSVRPVGLTYGAETGRVVGVDADGRVGLAVSRADVARFVVGLVRSDRWDNGAVTVGLPS